MEYLVTLISILSLLTESKCSSSSPPSPIGLREELSNPDYCLDCSIVDCVPEIKPWDCPHGYFYKQKMYFGCCGACVKYLALGESCDLNQWSTQDFLSKTTELECRKNGRVLRKEFVESKSSKGTLIPGFHLIECGPDALCSEKGVCELKRGPPCSHHRKRYQDWLKKNDCMTYEWEPRCNEMGYYTPVQSMSNLYRKMKKFCSDTEGNSISGAFSYDKENPLSSCICSRKKNELIKIAGLKDTSIHCSNDGSFEKLQCQDDFCWCIDPQQSQKASLSTVVPMSLVHLLDCYKSYEVGKSYLRRCESRSITKTKVESILQKHGTYWSEVYATECEYDGSFGRKGCTSDPSKLCRCLDPNGNQIKQYLADIGTIEIDCRCARDEYLELTEQECVNRFGGYKQLQRGLSDEWCVDENGFQWSLSVMEKPLPDTNKRCKIDGCKESMSHCTEDNCLDCSNCSDCKRVPGETCYP